MSYMQIVMLCGLCFGPLVTIILLQVNGDQWLVPDMLLPWNITLGFSATAGLVQFFMHDKWCLPNEEMGTIRGVFEDQEWYCLRTQHIPYLTLYFDTISGIASGMSIKFFPLFFQQEVGYTPTEVQIVYAVSFLATAIATWIAVRLAKKIGRIQTVVLVPLVGLLFMTVLIIGKTVGLWTPQFKWLIGGVFTIRTALMNAPTSISKSVVDDYVSSEKRGCWNSLEFIFIIGWSGSAMLGGLLIESVGYQNTFIITVLLQFVSIMMYLLLIPLVPKKEYNLSEIIHSETDPLIN
jgi:predicted MFS family arabinose efflux permease